MASDLAALEPVLRAGADHGTVTTAPILAIVRELEKLTASVRRRWPDGDVARAA